MTTNIQPTEKSIIQEIIEQVANHLQVPPYPLVEESFPTAATQAAPAESTTKEAIEGVTTLEEEKGAVDTAEQKEDQFIPLFFDEYNSIMRQLQAFKASGDQSGYQKWFHQATTVVMAVVNLRGLESRLRQKQALNLAEEYNQIATRLAYRQEQVAELHRRIQKYDRLQQLIGRFFSQGEGNLSPAVATAAQKLWPQLQRLFRAQWKAATLSATAQPLLQPLPETVRQQLSARLQQFFREMEALNKL